MKMLAIFFMFYNYFSYKPNPQEAEAEGLPQVWNQPDLQNEFPDWPGEAGT